MDTVFLGDVQEEYYCTTHKIIAVLSASPSLPPHMHACTYTCTHACIPVTAHPGCAVWWHIWKGERHWWWWRWWGCPAHPASPSASSPDSRWRAWKNSRSPRPDDGTWGCARCSDRHQLTWAPETSSRRTQMAQHRSERPWWRRRETRLARNRKKRLDSNPGNSHEGARNYLILSEKTNVQSPHIPTTYI